MRKPIVFVLMFFFVFSLFPAAVLAADIDTVAVTAPKTTVAVGETLQATATLYYNDSTSQNITSQVTWQSQDESIATVTAGIITGQGEGTVLIDAIYTAPDSSIYSGQIQITVIPAVLDYMIFPDSKLAIIVGQEITIRAKNKAGVLTDDISLQHVSGNGVTAISGNTIQGLQKGYDRYEVSFIDGSKQQLTIFVKDTGTDDWGSATFSLDYVTGARAIPNAPEGQEDEFFGLPNSQWTVDPTRISPPWTVLSNPGGTGMGDIYNLNIGQEVNHFLNFSGFDKGTINISFESEPGSYVAVPGQVDSPINGKGVFDVTHIRGDDHRCHIPLKITAPIGEPHRARVVVELWDDGNLMFKGYLPIYVRAYPRPETIQVLPLKTDGNVATLTEIINGTPVTLRWHPLYFCNNNHYAESTATVLAPDVIHEWEAKLSGFDADMNYITIPIPGLSGVDDNGILQSEKSTMRTKTGNDGVAEVEFIFNPPSHNLRFAELKITSSQIPEDNWKLIMPTTGLGMKFTIYKKLDDDSIGPIDPPATPDTPPANDDPPTTPESNEPVSPDPEPTQPPTAELVPAEENPLNLVKRDPSVFLARYLEFEVISEEITPFTADESEIIIKTGLTPEKLQELADKELQLRGYYWNARYNKWVALPSFPDGDGAVKVINPGYEGQIAVFAVKQPRFVDIQPTPSSEIDIVNRLNGLALVEGYPGAGLDRPVGLDRNITNAEVITILARSLGVLPAGEQKMYSILSVPEATTMDHWSAPYVEAMQNAGIVGDIALDEPAVNIRRYLRNTFAVIREVEPDANFETVDTIVSGLTPSTMTRSEFMSIVLQMYVSLGW